MEADGHCDIVVPVWHGVHYVRDLLRSIRRHTDVPYRVILNDDSDDDATHAALSRLARDDERIELHRNETNLGFVKSSNRGFARAQGEFVCLMNSDTLVSEGWLSKLLRCMRSDPRIAVACPLSNRSSDLSVAMAPGLNLNTMAAAIEQQSRRRYPDITTAVGFCMMIRRAYLESHGTFDEAYGRGYCEEQDLCMRYTESGLRVVSCDDAFVYHRGQGAFGETWKEHFIRNRRIFDERWGAAYQRDWAAYEKRNPLQYVRDGLLRYTIAGPEWSIAAAMIVERSARRFRRPIPDASGVSPQARRLQRRPRTQLNARARDVRFPTRGYVDRLPTTGGFRITFLMAERIPVCGGVTTIVNLAREFVLARHDVILATTCPELKPERFNLPCQPLIYPNQRELIRLLPHSDVVVATFWTTAEDYLPAIRRRSDALTVYLVQGYEGWLYPDGDDRRRRVAATYALADHCIVMSDWLRDLIAREHGVTCEKVPIGMDLGIFRPRKASAKLGPRPRALGLARPPALWCGFRELAEAYRELHERRPEIELVLFGASDDALPSGLSFPFVNAGRIEDPQRVAELIGSCDVLIDPSHFQGFGRPGLEAMACGTCCVLPTVGGGGEYARDGENCLRVPPGDAKAIAAATTLLLDDEALRERLMNAGFETAARYCHIAEARQHLALYEKCLAERRGLVQGG